MSKQKSVFVSVLLAVLLAALIATAYTISRAVFFAFVGLFALIGFVDCAIAFYKWLKQPLAKENEPASPPEVVLGEDAYDFKGIVDEVMRDAEI
jgi:uncharacterized membrane protein